MNLAVWLKLWKHVSLRFFSLPVGGIVCSIIKAAPMWCQSTFSLAFWFPWSWNWQHNGQPVADLLTKTNDVACQPPPISTMTISKAGVYLTVVAQSCSSPVSHTTTKAGQMLVMGGHGGPGVVLCCDGWTLFYMSFRFGCLLSDSIRVTLVAVQLWYKTTMDYRTIVYNSQLVECGVAMGCQPEVVVRHSAGFMRLFLHRVMCQFGTLWLIPNFIPQSECDLWSNLCNSLVLKFLLITIRFLMWTCSLTILFLVNPSKPIFVYDPLLMIDAIVKPWILCVGGTCEWNTIPADDSKLWLSYHRLTHQYYQLHNFLGISSLSLSSNNSWYHHYQLSVIIITWYR